MSPCPASPFTDAFVMSLMSAGISWPANRAAVLDGRFGRLREGQRADTAVGHRVALRTAAALERRDLLKFLLEILRRREIRARVRVNRLAAGLRRAPREVLARVAPDRFDLFPRHVELFGDDSGTVHHRTGAEIADARMHVDLAVVTNEQQSVHRNRAGRVGAEPDADAGDFRSDALAVAALALFPLEELRAEIERFAQMAAREKRPARWRRRSGGRDRLLTRHLAGCGLPSSGRASLLDRLRLRDGRRPAGAPARAPDAAAAAAAAPAAAAAEAVRIPIQ